MAKISRYKKAVSDRSGFEYLDIEMTYDNGSKVGADEYDTPPPSTKPLGGEGDISTGDKQNDSTWDAYTPFTAPVVQYLNAASTVSVRSYSDVEGDQVLGRILYITGSNSNITLSSNPNISQSRHGDTIALYGVGSTVTLMSGSGNSLYKNITINSGMILNLIYSQTDSLWHEVSRSHVTENLGEL